MSIQPAGLISVLLDPTASPAEQDDAAMDLGDFDEPEAEAALMRRARELAEVPPADPHYIVAASCGESLAEIWCRQDRPPSLHLRGLRGIAYQEALGVLRVRRPEWRLGATGPAA